RGHPAGQAELEGGGRQRVHREEQGERVGVPAVGEAEPGAHLAPAGGLPEGPPEGGRVQLEHQPVGDGGAALDRGGAVLGAGALVHRRDRGRFGGGAHVVGEGVQVAVGGEDAGALDLAALLVVLEEGRLAGRQAAPGAHRLRADDRRARLGGGQVVGGDGERVGVRQGVAERTAQDGQQIAAVDGVDDRPAGGEVDVVDAGLATDDRGVAVELGGADRGPDGGRGGGCIWH